MVRLHSSVCACASCSAAPSAEREHAAEPSLPGGSGATKPVYTSDQIIAALTTMDGGHASLAWNGSVVSYSIGTGRLSRRHPEYSGEHAGYAAMTPAMMRAAAEAFELWDDVIAISLDERPSDPFSDIVFNYSAATGDATYTRYSYYLTGGRADRTLADADIWFATGWWTHDQDSDLYQGGYGILTYLHEIGHGLGLSHPGRYNGSATYAANASYFQDTRAYTVMSYFNARANGSGTDHSGPAGLRYAATPLLHDIMTAQAIYGADMTTRTGDTTYGFNSNAGRDAFDFDLNAHPVVAIWDAGGEDTIDVSGWDTDQIVYLKEGVFSSVGHLTHNLVIAFGAVIENAVAGGGRDLLVGNAARNVLAGGAGDDRLEGWGGDDTLLGGDGRDNLQGGAGDDLLEGGAGQDYLHGGAGTDTASFRGAGSGVFVNLTTGKGTLGDARGDRLVAIEHLQGSAHDDTLVGNGSANWLAGGDGDDFLTGQGGNDWLEGGPGADRLKGDGGSDWAVYTGSAVGVTVDLALGLGTGGDAEGDSYRGIENVAGSVAGDVIIGTVGRNRLEGNGGDDSLMGGGGNDTLVGGDGDDTLVGGAGADVLEGGPGADLFLFAPRDGRDRIEDFELAHDRIGIMGAVAGFEQLAFAASSAGASVMYGRGDVILLAGIDVGDVTADHFIFLFS